MPAPELRESGPPEPADLATIWHNLQSDIYAYNVGSSILKGLRQSRSPLKRRHIRRGVEVVAERRRVIVANAERVIEISATSENRGDQINGFSIGAHCSNPGEFVNEKAIAGLAQRLGSVDKILRGEPSAPVLHFTGDAATLAISDAPDGMVLLPRSGRIGIPIEKGLTGLHHTSRLSPSLYPAEDLSFIPFDPKVILHDWRSVNELHLQSRYEQHSDIPVWEQDFSVGPEALVVGQAAVEEFVRRLYLRETYDTPYKNRPIEHSSTVFAILVAARGLGIFLSLPDEIARFEDYAVRQTLSSHQRDGIFEGDRAIDPTQVAAYERTLAILGDIDLSSSDEQDLMRKKWTDEE